MTPAEFIAKWLASTRNERAACQEHFIDLCHLLGEPTPNSDPSGEDYAFEKGAIPGRSYAEPPRRLLYQRPYRMTALGGKEPVRCPAWTWVKWTFPTRRPLAGSGTAAFAPEHSKSDTGSHKGKDIAHSNRPLSASRSAEDAP